MPVLMFQSRFARQVAAGTKRRTIRPQRKRPLQVGHRLSLRQWSAKPYRSRQIVLGAAVVSRVSAVTITDCGIVGLDEITEATLLDLASLDGFARLDGFTDWPDMRTWFRAHGGLPFTGVMIEWAGIEPATGQRSSWRLKRTKQCAKCPWKVSTNPHDIPNGYSVARHEALACTIAQPGDVSSLVSRKAEHVMGCHEMEDAHCVGWLGHQLGRGNNIALRMRMRTCENASEIRLSGDQHQTFEATLPGE
jgi:hypothetical protein